MTSSFVCATLNLGRKKSTGTEPKTVLVESANQFSLEELCRKQYSLKYFFRSHIDHQTYGKILTNI